ncbi:group II intron reverse transcriptase/maturase [bacterium]|nr:group II intron reverse transcriptase/maturase [bacterium]
MKSVSRTLLELREKAEREPKHRFRSLYREINLPMLYESFHQLKRKAAPGIDGVTVADYEKELDHNLRQLLDRLINKRYRAQNVRRRHIPKGKGKTRALGIPSLEDKIVQQAASQLLQAIYEVDFLDVSKGYRPRRGARDASQELREQLFQEPIHWVVEADIKGFFDHVDHDWLQRMLEQRVDDKAFIGLIRKWLKAGIQEESGDVIHPATGTPQGGVISPVLSNIYLHYVMDLWVEKIVPKKLRGAKVYMRYADDFIVGFQYEEDATWFFQELPKRLAKFSLTMAMEKSGICKFSRGDMTGSSCFTFIGFEFYWARTRRGYQTVKRRTSKSKFKASLSNLKEWMRTNRSYPLRDIVATLKRKLRGYTNYYGVIGNSHALRRYWYEAQQIIYRWLNRRSQRRSYTWEGFNEMWKTLAIPTPRIVEQPYRQGRQCQLLIT